MDANGKKNYTQKLITRACKAIEDSRDYLNEFHRRWEERQDKWERDHPRWESPNNRGSHTINEALAAKGFKLIG